MKVNPLLLWEFDVWTLLRIMKIEGTKFKSLWNVQLAEKRIRRRFQNSKQNWTLSWYYKQRIIDYWNCLPTRTWDVSCLLNFCSLFILTISWLEMFLWLQFLSMRLAAVNPRIDFNVDALLAAEVSSLRAYEFYSLYRVKPYTSYLKKRILLIVNSWTLFLPAEWILDW